MDGSTGEAALFQLTFYEDAAKTTEITDLDITFKAVISRIDIPPDGTNLAISAYAGSGVVDLSTNDNIGVVSLDGLSLHITNESANVFAWDNDLVAASPDLTPQRVEGTGSVVFGPSDSFWLRRSNLSGGADDVYQLGAVIFTVAPAWQGSIAIDQLSGTNAVGVSWSASRENLPARKQDRPDGYRLVDQYDAYRIGRERNGHGCSRSGRVLLSRC